MRKVFCGTSGTEVAPNTHNLSAVNASKELLSAFIEFYHSDFCLRPAQEEALIQQKLLEKNDNAIVATPTNSGKSLISYLLLFDAAIKAQTVVLVEPLRALAYEKSEELKRMTEIIKVQSKKHVDVVVTTGDYRLTDEFMHSKPIGKSGTPHGQIIVATPERLDAISRNPDNQEWFRNIRVVCFDEAHLLGDAHRGATLELLIAYLRSLKSELRIILMSATISNTAALAAWLAPCSVVSDVPRYPTLDKWVYCIEDGDDVDNALLAEIADILKTEGTSVLIFVYQTASAKSLAHKIAEKLSGQKIKKHDLDALMSVGTAWFHSKMSAATKGNVISAVNSGGVRVVVSTTALSMGINLPATHVFVRDVSFAGVGDLGTSDLMQMIGRAGRGDKKGFGVICLSRNNLSKETSVVQELSAETVPEIKSRLVPISREGYFGAPREDLGYIDRVGNQVMGIINRCGNITLTGFKDYLTYTLAGDAFENLPMILQKLSDWKLAYLSEDTNEYSLTHLGKISSHCYLPPLTAANIGQLIRDLLEDMPDGKHISQFSAIDFLIVLCLTSNESRQSFRFSKGMVEKIHEYMESLPLEEKSYLYRTWIASSPEMLYGSARVDGDSSEASKRVYQSTYSAMLLYDISHGYSSARLQQDYHIDAEEIQEKLRDNAIWILCGMEQLLEVKSFYYHLKETCQAEYEQIQCVDSAFANASRTIFALIANLKFRSNLGELVRGIKRVYPNAASYPGEGTLQRLEKAGITKLKYLAGKSEEDMLQYRIRPEYIRMIVGYVQKRMS